MLYQKNCVSDRHYIIRYPAFSADKNAKRTEVQGILRMNGFYDTLKNEIIAYCGELSEKEPRMMYLADTECTVTEEEEEHTLSNGDEIPWDCPLTVRIALILRNRPEPTRRLGLVHRWVGGNLVK